MKIYKEHIIEALETEPLGFNSWCRVPGLTEHGPARVQECTVCAVGSIFRKYTNMAPMEINESADGMMRGDHHLDKEYLRDIHLPENWPTALSWVWEELGKEITGSEYVDKVTVSQVEEARVHIIDWVEDNVPEDEVLWTV